MNSIKRIMTALLVLLLFTACLAGTTSASTIESSTISDCNVYGSQGQTTEQTGVTATNVTNNPNEYIAIKDIQFTPDEYNLIGDTIAINYTQIGSSVSLDSNENIVVNNISIEYGEGGTSIGDINHVMYSSAGNKTVVVSNIGWNGLTPVTNSSTKYLMIYNNYPEIIKDAAISIYPEVSNLTTLNGSQGDIIYVDLEVEELPTLTYSYQWYDNGVLIDNAVSNYSVIFTPENESSTEIIEHTYNAIISNSIHSINSSSVTFYAYPVTPPEAVNLTGVVNPVGSLVGSVTLDVEINPRFNDNVTYVWEYKLNSSTEWTALNTGTFNRNTTSLSYVHNFNIEQLSILDYRIALSKPDKFPDTYYSNEFQFTAYEKPYNMNIEQDYGFTFVSYDINATVKGFAESSTYLFEYSADNGTSWTTIFESEGQISGIQEQVVAKSVVFEEAGSYLVRNVVTQDGISYYSNPVSIEIYSYPRVIITTTPSSGLLSSGTPVSLSVTSVTTGFSEITGYKWQYSTDDVTWNDISGETSSTLNYTHTFSSVGGIYFRLIVTDSIYGDIESNVNGYVAYTEPIVSTSGLGTSTADEYTIPIKTTSPFPIIETYAVSSTYGLVVTTNAAYIIDGTLITWENKSVISSLFFSQGIVSECKYLNGHLIAKTLNGDVFVVNVLTSSFGDSTDLIGFENADYIDSSQFKFMVGDIGVGAYVYNLDGSIDSFIKDTTNNVFGITKHASDESQAIGILAANNSSNIIRGYKSDGTYVTITINGNVQSITGLSDQTNKIIAITDSSTAFISYTLNSLSFSLSTVEYANMILTSPDSSYSGNAISGGSGSTFTIITSSGNTVSNFPTASQITETRIARSSENLALSGGNNGQVYILSKNANGWSGLQSFSIKSMVNSMGISDEGYIILAANTYEVYSGIHTKDESQGEVVTTLYYLTVTVYDENGQAMPNTQFRVTSDKGSTLYSTDSYGSRTVQVAPTYDYTFSLPNGEDSVTINANNYALQYISLQYPKVNVLDGVSYSAKLNNNRNITMMFNDVNSNLFNLTIEIKDENKIPVYTYNGLTSQYSYIFDTKDKSPDSKYFYVSMSGSYNGKSFKDSWIFEIQKYDDGTGGTTTDPNQGIGVVLGDIPFLPSELGENWTTFLFGGLIMIIGGLFGYAHSAKGCVLMVIIAAVLTFVFHVLPINPIWMGCMVVLGFLAIYSWASQNEGN